MNKKLLVLPLLALCGTAGAQVKIGNNPGTIDPSSVLELEQPNKAFYINRVSLTSTIDQTTVPNPKAGMMVYNTNTGIGSTPAAPATTTGSGLYYWNGTRWVAAGNDASTGGAGLSWLLLGNNGTVDGVNFLGTTDNVPLNFRVGNVKSGRIEGSSQTGNVAYGWQSQLALATNPPTPNGDGSFNTSVGNLTLAANTLGNHNSAMGYDALGANTTGDSNSAFGFGALQVNTTGRNSSAFGAYSLNHNTIGAYNTAVGYEALLSNVVDSGLTSVGAFSLYNNNGGKLNVAMGLGTMFANLTGSFNTAVGTSAMRFNFVGNENTAMGINAGFNNNNPLLGAGLNGNRNTFIGTSADSFNISGNNITTLGWRSGYANTGSFNTFLGANAGVPSSAPSLTYSAAIGAGAVISNNNGMALGATDAGSVTTISSNVGINVTDPTQRIDFRNGHIRNRQDNLPTVTVQTSNGLTGASVVAGSSDVRGRIMTVGSNTTTGISVIRVNFAYTSTNPPFVQITPANEAAIAVGYYVTSDVNGFTLNFRSAYIGGPGGPPNAEFNYMVIE